MAKAASWRGASAGALLALAGVVAVASCVGNIGPPRESSAGTAGASATGSAGTGSSTGGAGATIATGTAAGGGGGGDPAGTGGSTVVVQCNGIAPGRSPLRRLTTYEYNNTVRDLLGDTTNPGSALPAQVDSKQNPFGNDADEQSPTDVLVEKYQTVAEAIAARATANATALGKLHSCATNVTAANEEGCARMIATSLAPRALRRAVATTEIDELVTLYKNVRALSTTIDVRVGRGGDDRSAAASAGVPLSRRARRGRRRQHGGEARRGPRDGDAPVVHVLADHAGRDAVPGRRCRHARHQGGRAPAGPEAARQSEVASDGGVLLRQPAAHSGPLRSHP